MTSLQHPSSSKALPRIVFTLGFLLSSLSFAGIAGASPSDEANSSDRSALIRYLDSLANKDLAQRRTAITAIQTQNQAIRRRDQVKETIYKLLGGAPIKSTDLHAQVVGTLQGEGFHVEKIIYDSLPGFHVTANLYLPEGATTPVPGVIYTSGHGPAGKAEAYTVAGNLARNGIAVLAYDPMGEGERIQFLDPETGRSIAGRPTGEHGEAGALATVFGDHIARYFLGDAMSGIDYLTTRKEIDANRIGAFGCSGGGTVTAYLAALDERIKVAATACYITTFQELLPTAGPQDAEQSIPGFLQAHLDLADWVELAAPKPYAIVSTTEDMFPFAGAKTSYEEAKRIYGIYGAADRLQWITGPGRHGALKPIMPQILSFFTHWLGGSNQPASMQELTSPGEKALWCTSTGQVGSSMKGKTISSILQDEAKPQLYRRPALEKTSNYLAYQKSIASSVKALSGATDGSSLEPRFKILTIKEEAHYTTQDLLLEEEDGITVTAKLSIPEHVSSKTAVLILSRHEEQSLLASSLTKGQIVMSLQPRPSIPGTEEQKSALLGTDYLLSLRAMLVGKNLVGMQTQDALTALHWMKTQRQFSIDSFSIYGKEALGVVALHTSVLEPQVTEVTLEKSLLSYRLLLDQNLHRNLPAVTLPAVLRSYDLDDLMLTLASRASITLINPVDATGQVVSAMQAQQALDETLKTISHLHLAKPLRLEVH